MNPTSTELAKKALEILQDTQVFILDQAPDFMQQILAWKLAINIFGVIVSVLILLIIGLASMIFFRRELKDGSRSWLEVLMAAMPPFIFFIACSLDILKIHYAPKLFLMEYFLHLLK